MVEEYDILSIFSLINFFSSSIVKGEKLSWKYLFTDIEGSSILIAALKESLPSFIKIISSTNSPSYIKNSSFLEILGIKLFRVSAIKTELWLFLKNLKSDTYLLYIVNKILFFKENGKVSINELTSCLASELALLSKWL